MAIAQANTPEKKGVEAGLRVWCDVCRPRYAPDVELEVRHLRALCAIADTGSVRKAARQLGMTQPSLTTQLHRIEKALGGQLFFREPTGSRPTPLGHAVLCRARPIVAEMRALIDEIASASHHERGARLHIGSTNSPAVAGWLRRLRVRLPETDTTIRADVSANALLHMVATGQLDAAFVHEVEGAPLRVPDGLVEHELVAREPQFIALADSHPAAARAVVRVADLADDQWMVDPTVDGEWAGLRRIWAAAGITPRVVHGDYLTAVDLVTAARWSPPASRPPVPGTAWRSAPCTATRWPSASSWPAARTPPRPPPRTTCSPI